MELKTLIFSILFVCCISVNAQDKVSVMDKSTLIESNNLNDNRSAVSIMNTSVSELNSEDISSEVKIISIKKSSNSVTNYNNNSRKSVTITPTIIENNTSNNNKRALKNNEEKSPTKRVNATILTIEPIEN